MYNKNVSQVSILSYLFLSLSNTKYFISVINEYESSIDFQSLTKLIFEYMNIIYVLHLFYAKMFGHHFHLGPAALLFFTPLKTLQLSTELMKIVTY